MLKALVLTFTLLSGFLFASQDSFGDLVSIEWLKKHLNDKNLVIIDVRKEELYKKGHIKRAINLPVFKYFFYGKNLMLPPLDQLVETFSKAGIDEKTNVVVYGDKELIWAARAYWVGKLLGHKNTALLDGDFQSWKNANLPVTTKICKNTPKKFIPKIDDSIMKTKLATYMAMKKEVIVDGRPPEYYIGEKTFAKRAGHIPTALNYPGSMNYIMGDKGSKMKPFEKLKEIYKDLPKDKEIILYCGDGADAALNYLVLKQLGYKVSVYEGSWLEWGNDENMPIEKGHPQRDK
jgi:thiosulfate/3-mercaptopyruvate sulfurtransferase